MKITTWNVNGLRATLNKGFLQSIQTLQPDVYCLQEIKSRPEQLPAESLQALVEQFPHHTWNPAERPGYSGTASLARVRPLEEQLGMGIPDFDGEGRLIAHRFADFWLFNVYFPNGQRDLGRVPYKLDFYASLLDWCDRLHQAGQQVIITGDFNTAHNEIDLKHPKANSTATGFLPEERAWIDKYLSHGLADAYRRLYPQRVQYTWWTFISNARARDVGWRLDYFLVSEGLMPRVADVVIHNEIMGSDHCPVTLVLND